MSLYFVMTFNIVSPNITDNISKIQPKVLGETLYYQYLNNKMNKVNKMEMRQLLICLVLAINFQFLVISRSSQLSSWKSDSLKLVQIFVWLLDFHWGSFSFKFQLLSHFCMSWDLSTLIRHAYFGAFSVEGVFPPPWNLCHRITINIQREELIKNKINPRRFIAIPQAVFEL